MTFEILWTSEALTTFEDRITYIKINWTDREIANFKIRTKEYLETLSKTPFIGKKPGKLKDVYMGLILRPVSLIYRVNKQTAKIELLSFIDNRQDPKKTRKYR